MKHPFKIAALIIFAGVVIYAAWPGQTVREHNPKTGEGSHAEELDHKHLDPALLLPPEERAEILQDEARDPK